MSTTMFLYLGPSQRRLYKKEIRSYHDILRKRLFNNFLEIEQEANEYSQKLFEEFGNLPGDGSVDMSDIADMALNKGINFYEELSSVKYVITAATISSLSRLWEQQIMRFIFNEIRRYGKFEFNKLFGRGIIDIKEILSKFDFEIENMNCWSKLNELRLLCNVIKHGDGRSAKELRAINPDMFQKLFFDKNVEIQITVSLLEEVLTLSVETFENYVEIVIAFWDEFPKSLICELK